VLWLEIAKMAKMQSTTLARLTSGHILARNIVINLIGQGVPVLVAIFSIPLLTSGLGTERFGVLLLVWMVVGYFGIFDLGLGRALTKLVADKLGENKEKEIPALVWTSLFLMLILGLIGTVTLGLLSPWLIHRILKIPEVLQSETLHAFYLLAIFIPIVTSTTGLVGVLAAWQRFYITNAVRIPLGIFTYLRPLLLLPFSNSLVPVVAVLVGGRLLAWIVYLGLCFHIMPSLRHNITLRRTAVGPLLRFGSWLTVTNIVSPLMVSLDRFLIGALTSVAAVAYYATPQEMVTRLLNIPAAVVNVLFPAFAAAFTQDHNHATPLFDKGVRYIFLAMFPPTLLIVAMSYEVLNFWVGAEFAQNSTCVLQWFAVGVLLNSLGRVAFTFVQAVGRADLN